MVQSSVRLILQRTLRRSFLPQTKSLYHRNNTSFSASNSSSIFCNTLSSGQSHSFPTRDIHVASTANLYRLNGDRFSGTGITFQNRSSQSNRDNHKPCALTSQQRRTKVFVSKHNQSLNVTPNQIAEYCHNQGISQDDLRTTNTHVIMRECPFCQKPTKGKADNMFKLYVQIGGGAYYCHRCGSKGSWFDFKHKLGGYDIVDSKGQVLSSSRTRASTTVSSSSPMYTKKRPNNNNKQNQSNHQYHSNELYKTNNRNNSSSLLADTTMNITSTCLPMPSPKLQATYITNLLDNDNVSSENALTYLTTKRGLTKQTLRKFGVGLGSYSFPCVEPGKQNRFVKADCVTFPWIMKASEINEQESLRGGAFHHNDQGSGVDNDVKGKKSDHFVTRRIKARSLDNKANQRLDPPGGGWGLFGWHTVPDDAKEIIITEGEYDAMAVYQATGRHAVSLPNGCRSLPVEVLPMLERFDSVYLWMDNDGPGREGAETFAKKIGINRCFIVQPQVKTVSQKLDDEDVSSSSLSTVIPKDANEALLLGLDLEDMIRSASVVPHERVLTFAELRSQVIHEMLNPEKYVGVPVPSLPKLTGILKGFRRGELTVLTGPTGSGKTTLLSQLSLDFCENDVRTLWGSFEIKNTRLVHNLLKQYARGALLLQKNQDKQKQLEAIEVLADKFQELPLYFLKFHGGSDVDDVIDAMEYSVYVHDVQHIILDNMQFMLSRNSRGFSSFDKFDMQDIALEKFRTFATSHNVHVTLVVHPRKENEGDRLGMSSVYGSAKATQEADNVLILQNDGNRKFIEVKKNRFDGTVGYCPIHFDPDSRRYCDSGDSVVVPQRIGGGNNHGNFSGGSSHGSSGTSYHSNSPPAKISQRTVARSVSSTTSSSMSAPTPTTPIASDDGNRAVLKAKSPTTTWDSILQK